MHVPVWAHAIKSFPFKINGIACSCIGVAWTLSSLAIGPTCLTISLLISTFNFNGSVEESDLGSVWTTLTTHSSPPNASYTM